MTGKRGGVGGRRENGRRAALYSEKTSPAKRARTPPGLHVGKSGDVRI